jgi:molybdopterin molybdotransferase
LDAHRQRVLEGIAAVEPLEMMVADSSGCVIAADVLAVDPVPLIPAAAFEGIAVRSADVATADVEPVTLHWSEGAIASGDARHIHAGEPLPLGADAVIPTGSWRDVQNMFADGPDGGVLVESSALAGYGVWPVGHDCEPGETVVPAGTVVGPGAIALLVAAGVTRVSVIPKPRCVVLAVGEVAAPDPVLGMLAAVVVAAGGQAYAVGPIPADENLQDVLEDQLVRADVIVVCGSWPAGADDVMLGALRELGEVSEVDVAMEPAGRTWYACIGPARVPVLVVPVDPWAAFVSFDAFVLPLLRLLRGQDAHQRTMVTAECTADVDSVPDRHRYVLGALSQQADESRVQPLHPSRAGLLNAANCVVVLEPHGELRAGRPCAVYPLLGLM